MSTFVRSAAVTGFTTTFDLTGGNGCYVQVFGDSQCTNLEVGVGNEATLIGTITDTYGSGSTTLWRSTSFPSGLQTIYATMAGGGNTEMIITLVSGVNTTTPERDTPVAIKVNAGTAVTASPTSSSGDLMVQMLFAGGGDPTFTLDSGQTLRTRRELGGYTGNLWTKAASAGSTAMNLTASNTTDIHGFVFAVATASDTLTVTNQPTTATSGVAMGNVVITSSDTSFTGNVTIEKVSGDPTVSGTLTVAASAGVATFTNIIPTGTGALVLRAVAADHDNVTLATITVAPSAVPALGRFRLSGPVR
jgi:hypothetical protein